MAGHLHALTEYAATDEASGAYVLAVQLAGCGGERYSGIGVGDSVEEALTWARESAPAGTGWLVSGWADLYGE